MFHLVNISNPSEVKKAATLEELFNPLNTPWSFPSTQIRSITYRQYLTWLRQTITEETWEAYLAARVMRRQYVTLAEAYVHWEYKLVASILKDKPKWLLEFFGVNITTRQFTMDIMVPRSDSPYQLYYDTCGPFKYTSSDGVHPDSRADLDLKLDNMVSRFVEHLDRDFADGKIPYSEFTSSSSSLIARQLQFLLGERVIEYRPAHGDNRSMLTALQAHGMMVDFANSESKPTFTVNYTNESFSIVLREPRRPATREQLGTILNYSSDVLDYLPYNIRSNTEIKSPLYGIELETATGYHPRDVIAAQTELFFLCKQDGSISGNGAHRYEMVTVPATFKAHRRLWADWFNKLDYNKFDTSKNTSNGMHVHIDRKAFSDAHLNRFTWFFINPANFDFLFEVSERPNKNDFLRWAGFPYVGGTKINAQRNAAKINQGNRGAIHFKKGKTVEIRIFKGVVSYATIMKNLEFVDSVYNFTLELPLLNVTFKSYLDWLNKKPSNQYKLLREFFNQLKNLDNLTTANSIKDYLFGCDTPEKILDKLKKAPFQVTNKHLTVLNRERRKRTFILNKDGTLSLAYTTGGKLASLDKEMQAKITRGTSSFTINAI